MMARLSLAAARRDLRSRCPVLPDDPGEPSPSVSEVGSPAGTVLSPELVTGGGWGLGYVVSVLTMQKRSNQTVCG